MTKEIIRRRYTFYGRVQGVGFRFRAKYLARLHGVSGWVRNEYDGSVTMEAEGSPMAIAAVVEALRSDRFIQIDEMEMQEIPVCGSHGFESRG